MKKLILEIEDGSLYSVDVEEIAKNRKKYIEENRVPGEDRDYFSPQEAFDLITEDEFEAKDWLINNMNWWECQTLHTIRDRSEPNYSELEIEDYYFDEQK